MNKRYIDFVPAKGKTAVRSVSRPVSKPVAKPGPRSISVVSNSAAKKPTPKPAPKKITRRIAPTRDDFEIEEMFAERKQPVGVSASKGVKFGVIEEYQPKFVKTEVKKRPLGVAGNSQRGVPSKKVVKKPVQKPVVNPAQKPVVKPAYRSAPLGQRTTFLNTNKVEKRPLSANVYAKKPVVIPKEEKQVKPVKIIEKPEKDSKASLVIAIILTIILGAAAGTVAFLLLPK